jgi:hypothetical protein
MFGEGKPARGRTRILTDSARRKNKKGWIDGTKTITKINDLITFKAIDYILSIILFKPIDITKDDPDKKSLI